MAAVTPACGSCKYWVAQSAVKGKCHRYPPTLDGTEIPSMVIGHRPETVSTDWCGEFVKL